MPTPCQRCQALPGPLPESGTLYLRPPLEHTRGVLRDCLGAAGVDFAEPSEGILAVTLGPGSLRRLGEVLPASLTQAELRETTSMVLAEGATPSLADLMGTRPLSGLMATACGEWLVELLRGERLLTHFQPIVHAARPAEVFAYECLVRGRDEAGGLIGPGRLFEAARSADLLFHLDRMARLTAIRSAVRHDVRGCVFINFNPSSVYNPAACLRSTVGAVEEAGLPPSRFVFEVVESEEVRDTDHLIGILDHYRAAGFRVALDDVGAGYSSLNLLSRLRPDFVKLDMDLVRGVDLDPYKSQIAGKLLEMAQGLGVRTVVEGVETEGEWRWACDAGADYAQGFLFARPASPPPLPTAPRLAAARP